MYDSGGTRANRVEAEQVCRAILNHARDDIDLERASGRGAAALKDFLHYAQTGQLDLDRPVASHEPSAFEQVVRRATESLGHQVHAQVGLAGLFLDLAVVDPRDPNRYLLAIECHGPAYRACRSARDRDRLQLAVLEGQGWILHRIWPPDWLQRPAEQLQKSGRRSRRPRP